MKKINFSLMVIALASVLLYIPFREGLNELGCGQNGWIQEFYKDLSISLYAKEGEACMQVDPESQHANYYGDAACRHVVSYEPTNFYNYCVHHLTGRKTEEYIGNPNAWDRQREEVPISGKYAHLKWTNAYGTAADIYTLPLKNNAMAFMKKVEFRRVEGQQKEEECSLEMRVYKKNVLDKNLPPLLLLHGGGWIYRGLAVSGMESFISHLLEQGYMVFAPFHRLLLEEDAPDACQQATGQEILEDTNAAFDWVQTYGTELGAKVNTRITVVGQSAGAYLAGYLALHRSEAVEKGLLLYAPTDFQHMIAESERKYEDYEMAREVIPSFINERDADGELVDLPHINIKAPFVIENSLPEIIQRMQSQERANLPPLFLIHGKADQVIPVANSTRLCQALQGDEARETFSSGMGKYFCGKSRNIENHMRLIPGADHVLDLKCFGIQVPKKYRKMSEWFLGDHRSHFIPTLCPSKDQSGEALVNLALKEALRWLNSQEEEKKTGAELVE